jgi:hypothetical protein
MAHRKRSVNYKNEVLIKVIGKILPNGEYGWQAVAIAYQSKAKEEALRDSNNLKKTPVCPTTGKIDCSKKYFPVWAISKHVIHHCVTIVAAIYCFLCNTIVRTFGWERDTIHETDYIVHKRFSCLDHWGVLPHLVSVREFYPGKRMIPQ